MERGKHAQTWQRKEARYVTCGMAYEINMLRASVYVYVCHLNCSRADCFFTNFVLSTVQFEGNFRFPISSNNNMMGAQNL